MTTEDEREGEKPKDPESETTADESREDAAMRALVKRSLAVKTGLRDGREAEPPTDLLRGVQKRIRTRSKGKFYADGWSTSSSRVSYGIVAAVMLGIIVLAYFMLGPMGVSAK